MALIFQVSLSRDPPGDFWRKTSTARPAGGPDPVEAWGTDRGHALQEEEQSDPNRSDQIQCVMQVTLPENFFAAAGYFVSRHSSAPPPATRSPMT
jgi:hypothetical protein